MDRETQQLIDRILTHWDMPPTAERIRAWAELLADCDLGLAGTVFSRTRAEKHMTPATFAAEYKKVRPKRPTELYEPNWSGREISFAQHWALLNIAGQRGDINALDEIAAWRRYAENKRLPQRWASIIEAA